MADHAQTFTAKKTAATLLVLFIPSKNRFDQEIDQDYWVDAALKVIGELFGGGTAFPQGRGVWRDDAQGGILLFDKPVVIQCYTEEALIEKRGVDLRTFLLLLGTETRQGAVGLAIDNTYLEIGFDLPKES